MKFDHKRTASRAVLLAFVCISAMAAVSFLATPAGAARLSIIDSVGGLFGLVSGNGPALAGPSER